MPIEQFKSAWKFYKFQQELLPLNAVDVLAIIEEEERMEKSSKQLIFYQLAMFLLLVFCCQGG
ncbi:MAG: hypothetical protein AAGG68_05570 [Bacteroidota bacterium]